MRKGRIIVFITLLLLSYISLEATYHKIAHPDINISSGEMNIIDDILLVGDTLGLQIIDISNPVDPIIVGYYHTGAWVQHVEIVGDIAYIDNCSNGLLILDVSNPLDPQYIGSCAETTSIQSLTVDGDLVYIAAGMLGLQIVDASDLQNPILIGGYTSLSTKKIAYRNGFAFVGNDMGNVQVYDVSDPTEPVEVNWFNDISSLRDMKLVDTYLIILSWSEILIYDISDPTNFELLTSYDSALNSRIELEGNIAHLLCGINGVKILDISNLPQIDFIGAINSPRKLSEIVVSNNIAFVRDQYTGFEIYDISEPFNPDLVGATNVGYNLQTLSINNNYVYSAESESDLRIFDINNPQSPYLANSYNLYYNSINFIAHNNFGYATVAGDLYILSMNDPLHPGYISSIELENSANILQYKNEHIFIGSYSGYLTIINVSDYDGPYFVGECETPGKIYDLVVTNNYVYAADYDGGLAIIDISDPFNPFLISYFTNGPSYVYALERKGNILYLASSYDGVQVVDIIDPENPVFLETITNKPDSRFVAKPLIKDDILIIEDRAWNELLFYDISEHGSPQFINSYIWNIAMTDAEIHEDLLVVMNRLNGISILNLETITSVNALSMQHEPFNLSNYPNPFNPSTTIEFSIQNDSNVDLTIFNIKGQKIKIIAQNEFSKGSHSVIWNGDDELGESVSSGIYLYNLKVNGNTEEVKKCLLLK